MEAACSTADERALHRGAVRGGCRLGRSQSEGGRVGETKATDGWLWDQTRFLRSRTICDGAAVTDIGVAEESNERFRHAMEDTHCVVPRLDVPLPADCPCSAADSQLPAPLVRASSELSPTSSLLNFQDSPAPRPEDAPPTVSSPVTPASSPGHDPPPALMGIRSRSGSEGDLLEEPSPSPRMLVGAAALPKHTQPSAPEPEPCVRSLMADGTLVTADGRRSR